MQDVILKAVEVLGLIPAFPVKSLTTFANTNGKGVFRDCVLLWPGTTVLEFADIVHPEIAKHYIGAETIGNRKVSLLWTMARVLFSYMMMMLITLIGIDYWCHCNV